jgi:hypothetical protein
MIVEIKEAIATQIIIYYYLYYYNINASAKIGGGAFLKCWAK